MREPEQIMTEAFEKLSQTRKLLEEAEIAYKQRNSDVKADKENAVNVNKSILHLAHAYDEVSAIWENDINV